MVVLFIAGERTPSDEERRKSKGRLAAGAERNGKGGGSGGGGGGRDEEEDGGELFQLLRGRRGVSVLRGTTCKTIDNTLVT